jgi:hypothetical protein
MADDIGVIEELAVSIKCPMSMLPLAYDVIAGDELPTMVASELVEPRVELALIQLGSFNGNELLPDTNADARLIWPS